MDEKLTNDDPAEDLVTDDAISTFLSESFETKDTNYIAHELGIAAQVKGMAKIAQQTGQSCEQLYRSFSNHRNPTLKTTISVIKALGLDLSTRVYV